MAYSNNDKGHPLESSDKAEDRTPTLNESVSLITKDTGQDIIDTQGVNGHQLEVSNIHVHNAATLLERLNAAGRNANELKDMTENAYSTITEQDEATQSREQSIGMSR